MSELRGLLDILDDWIDDKLQGKDVPELDPIPSGECLLGPITWETLRAILSQYCILLDPTPDKPLRMIQYQGVKFIAHRMVAEILCAQNEKAIAKAELAGVA